MTVTLRPHRRRGAQQCHTTLKCLPMEVTVSTSSHISFAKTSHRAAGAYGRREGWEHQQAAVMPPQAISTIFLNSATSLYSWPLKQVFRSWTMKTYRKQKVFIWPFASKWTESILEPLWFDYSPLSHPWSSWSRWVEWKRMKDVPPAPPLPPPHRSKTRWVGLWGVGGDSGSLEVEHRASKESRYVWAARSFTLYLLFCSLGIWGYYTLAKQWKWPRC